jgi:dTDP-4-amino-4,6-dideoxygalactose transaminase
MSGFKIPYTNLYQQYIDCKWEIDRAIEETIATSQFITGPYVTSFESALCEYTGAEACASTGSGTTALACSLQAAGIGYKDEVITTPMTFVATTESIASVGAVPIFVDIDPKTYLINIDKIEQYITKRTRAILFVDLYGQCPDVDRLRNICNEYNLVLIEDAAQSFGNRYKGRTVGSLPADYTCVSFNPVKNLGAMGDAGCVLGSESNIELVRMYRDHGRSNRYSYERIGYNARIDNMQANIVRTKLPYLNTWLKRKRKICNYYTEQLVTVDVPVLEPGNDHTYYGYVIRSNRRDELKQHLAELDIETNIQYATTTNTQPAYKEWYQECPNAELAVKEILSIPSWYSLTDDQVQYIVDSINSFK